MTKQKAVTMVLSLILAVTVLAGAAGPAMAQTYMDDTTIEQGRQGVHLPGGFSSDVVHITRVPRGDAGWTPFRLVRDPIELHFTTAEGRNNNTPFVMTYVYFVVNNAQMRQYENGELNVYYLDVRDNTWRQCANTFIVADKNEDPENNRQGGRIACLATQYTLFGLGSPR